MLQNRIVKFDLRALKNYLTEEISLHIDKTVLLGCKEKRPKQTNVTLTISKNIVERQNSDKFLEVILDGAISWHEMMSYEVHTS